MNSLKHIVSASTTAATAVASRLPSASKMPEPLIRTASHKWKPDIIVGIDFGMTCTGVAYAELNANATSVPDPTNIQKWLGLSNTRLDDKVPTELIYTDRHEVEVQFWGSQCRKQALRSYVKRLFKLNIASNASNVDTYGHTTESARKHFKNYIAKVCRYVDECLSSWIPQFRSKRVEFVFSVPTTWMFDTETLSAVRRIVRDVIGDNQYRKATIGLTEAAAAAVDIGRNRFEKGDVILVCDTGGGTTDFNIVKMLSSKNEAVRMKALTYDEGISVGSTRIDQAALEFIRSAVGEVPGVNFSDLAAKAVYSNFQDIKHGYGTVESDVAYHLLPIPGLDSSDKLPPEHFEGTSFKISARKLKGWFDEQVDQIINLGEAQLQKLADEHKKEKVLWMVLSGGFGQNQYVRERLKEYLRAKITSRDSAIDPEVEVLSAMNPQLAVVRGLVYNQTQEAMGLTPVYEYVCSRMSYGIVVQEEYQKKKHQGQIPRASASDGKMWVHGQVDWIIRQGILIPSSGMKKTYEWSMNEGDENSSWSCHVVSCDYPREYLPANISHRDVKSVCKIEVDLDKLPFTNKRKTVFKKETYRQVMFDLIVIIGAADIRFQVHPRGEEDILASEEHGEIDVVWMKDEMAAKVEAPSSEERQPALSSRQPLGRRKTLVQLAQSHMP